MGSCAEIFGSRRLFVAVASLCLLSFQGGCTGPEPANTGGNASPHGVFDLRSWDRQNDPTWRLNDGWKFFPGERVRPSEAAKVEHYRTSRSPVDLTSSDIKKESFGVVYGTLRLPEGADSDLALMLTSFGQGYVQCRCCCNSIIKKKFVKIPHAIK